MKSGPLGLSRRALLALAGALNATRFATAADETEAPKKKVLRIAFRTAETGFDPAQINDLYSCSVTPHIFEGLTPMTIGAAVQDQAAHGRRIAGLVGRLQGLDD